MEQIKTVVTGMGMVTSLGNDVETTWNNLLDGKSGVDNITLFDASKLDTQIGAQVKDDFEEKAAKVIKKRERKKMTRVTRMAMVAAEEAIKNSGIDFSQCDRTRVGVIMGVVTSAYNDMERSQSTQNVIVKSMPNSISAWISINHGLLGPNFSVSTACASSAYAIGLGQQMIQSGMLDVVIVGGADSHINEQCISGFNQILALSSRNDSPKTACRPFSKTRDGFVMGEGAGIMILESLDHAKKRNAKIYGEVAGYALTSEAADITAPKENGVGMAFTMQKALESAGLEAGDIDYVNAHGTSTHLNDKYETMAIKKCFGKRAYALSISSTKSMVGHTIAASGVIEGIVTILSITNSVVTPTINYEDVDEELDLDYTPNQPKQREIRAAISNSFGFGGHNASVVYKKYEG